jgi:hypothetical protein
MESKVIVLDCGDAHRDLVNALTKKIEALKEQSGFIIFGEPKYFLVLRGAAKPKEEKEAFSFKW